MKTTARILLIISIALISNFTFAQNFTFKFEEGKVLNYQTQSVIDISMVMDIMGTEQEVAMKIDLTYDLKLTPKEFMDHGSTLIYLEPSNVKAHWDMDQAGMKIIMDMEGEDLIATSDGVTFVDTKNGIGLAEGEEIIAEMRGLYESGDIEITSKGEIGEISGSDEFVSFWEENTESTVGFFGIVFSDENIAQNESWKVPFSLETMGEISLIEPLEFDVEFTYTGDEKINGNKYQMFTGNSPYDINGIQGVMGADAGGMTLDIDNFERSAEFNVLFDREQGKLIDNITNIDGKALMTTKVEGMEMSMDLFMKAKMVIKLME